MDTVGAKSNNIEVMVRSASAAISIALEKEKKDYKKRIARGSSKASRRPGTPIANSIPEDNSIIESSVNINRVALKRDAEASSFSTMKSSKTVQHRNGGSKVTPSSRKSKSSKIARAMIDTSKDPARADDNTSPNSQSQTSDSSNSDAMPAIKIPIKIPLAVTKKQKSNRRTTFGGMLTKMFKGKLTATKAHLPICGVTGSTADDILKDLDFTPMSSPGREGKSTVPTPDNTMEMVKTNPKLVLKRVSRYRKKAKKLLDSIPPSEQFNSKTVANLKRKDGTDYRDLTNNARKAYQYASEARRLNDLLQVHYSGRSMTRSPSISTALSNPNASWQEVRELILSDKPITTLYSPSILDNYSVTSDEKTAFSERVEREDHERRMDELKLFAPGELNFLKNSTDKVEAGAFYNSEAHRILRTFSEEVREVITDDMTAMSPVTTFSSQSVMTTRSELEARNAYQEKLAELELFTSANITGSVNHVLATMQSTIDRSLQTFTEKIMAKPAKQDDDSIFDTGMSDCDDSLPARSETKVTQQTSRIVMPYDKLTLSSSGSDSDRYESVNRSCSEGTSASYRSGLSGKSSYTECDAVTEGSEGDTAERDCDSSYSNEGSSGVDSFDDRSESGSDASNFSEFTGRSEYTGESSRTGQSEYTDQSAGTGQSSRSSYSEYTDQSLDRDRSGLTDWSGVTETAKAEKKDIDTVQQVIGWIRRL